mgnify:CR=1 FL=1
MRENVILEKDEVVGMNSGLLFCWIIHNVDLFWIYKSDVEGWAGCAAAFQLIHEAVLLRVCQIKEPEFVVSNHCVASLMIRNVTKPDANPWISITTGYERFLENILQLHSLSLRD